MAIHNVTLFDAADINDEKFKFICNLCNYKGNKKSNFNTHLLTAKHVAALNAINVTPKMPIYDWVCKCDKKFKHSSSLYRHKKICNFVINTALTNNINCINSINSIDNNDNNDNIDNIDNIDNSDSNDDIHYKELIMQLLKENNEFKELLIKQSEQITELIPKIGNNNTVNNTVNNKFNFQVFLDEKCKGALNITDFIKSIVVSFEQLDLTKTKGLAIGLSNTIIENMNKLSVYERPLHCTDVKRETLYVKENDIWSKDKNKETVKNALKNVSTKNYKALQNWIKDNPDYKDIIAINQI